MQMWREFSVSQLADVLDKIRNVVLGLALEIEAANPDPGEAAVGSMPVEPERVSADLQQRGRKRPGAVIGRRRLGNLDSVRGRRAAPGDLHSLIEGLREANYDEADIRRCSGRSRRTAKPARRSVRARNDGSAE